MKEKLRNYYIYREILSPIWHKCMGIRVGAKDRRKFNADMKKYISLYEGGSFELNKQNNFKCLADWRAQAGTLGGYFGRICGQPDILLKKIQVLIMI